MSCPCQCYLPAKIKRVIRSSKNTFCNLMKEKESADKLQNSLNGGSLFLKKALTWIMTEGEIMAFALYWYSECGASSLAANWWCLGRYNAHQSQLFALLRCLLCPWGWVLSCCQLHTVAQAAIMAAKIKILTKQMSQIKCSCVWSDFFLPLRQLRYLYMLRRILYLHGGDASTY